MPVASTLCILAFIVPGGISIIYIAQAPLIEAPLELQPLRGWALYQAQPQAEAGLLGGGFQWQRSWKTGGHPS